MELELQNNATDAVQLTANNEESNNSEITAVIDGQSESDDPANKHLNNRLITASCHGCLLYTSDAADE